MSPGRVLDPELGDLSIMLEPSSVAEVLRARWPDAERPVTVQSVDRHWVRYSPGHRFVAVYQVQGRLTTAPFTTFVVVDRDRSATRWTTAADDPVLVELGPLLRNLALADDLRPPSAGWEAKPLRYRPRRRCTLELRSNRGAVYAKVLATGATSQRAFLASCPRSAPNGFSFPTLRRFRSAPRLVATEPVEGRSAWTVLTAAETPSRERVRLSYDIGIRLADLHRVVPGSLPRRPLTNQLESLRPRLEVIDRLDRPTGRLAERLLLRLMSNAEPRSDDRRPVTCHGSFRFDQIRTSDDELTLMDFDSLGAGEPESDLGNCLAYLRWRQLRLPSEAAELRSMETGFIDGYQAGGGDLDERRLARFYAASCLKIAWRRYANLDVGEWPLVAGLLNDAGTSVSTDSVPSQVMARAQLMARSTSASQPRRSEVGQ